MPELKPKGRPPAEPANQPTIEEWLGDPRFSDSVARILPRHLTSERFVAVMLRQLKAVPTLRECSPGSILGSMIDAATLGLEVGIGGESWLIPYSIKGSMTASLQIGYQGHLKLAWQSDRVASIDADVVTREEVDAGRFTYQRGTDGFLHHRPIEDRELTEKTIAYAYALVWVKGSDRPVWRVMDARAIAKLRNSGRSANSPAWTNWFDEMAMAKVLKRTLKWVPKSRELAHGLTLDDEADAGVAQGFQSAGDVAALLGSGRPISGDERDMMAGAAKQPAATAGDGPPDDEGDPGPAVGGTVPAEVIDTREPVPVAATRVAKPAMPKGRGGLGI